MELLGSPPISGAEAIEDLRIAEFRRILSLESMLTLLAVTGQGLFKLKHLVNTLRAHIINRLRHLGVIDDVRA